MNLVLAIARLLGLAAFSLSAFFGLVIAGVGTFALDLTLTTGEAGWTGLAVSALAVLIGGILAIASSIRLRDLSRNEDRIIY